MMLQAAKCLKIMEASTGIEPVYTDLQSAASPLRQLAEGSASSIPTKCALQAAKVNLCVVDGRDGLWH